MEKQAHIDYWIKSAADDEDTMDYLFKGKKYVHALFFGHLMIEKICKALWVKNNDINNPPKTHNIAKHLKQSNITIDENQLALITKLFQYQIEGRYPSDLLMLHKMTDKDFAKDYIHKTIEFKLWLLNKLL